MEVEDTAERFLQIIRPHVALFPCMAYKLKFGYDSGRNNIIKGNLTKEVLAELASEGMPIRQMAIHLGVGGATVDRYLRKHEIEHPRTKGNPEHRKSRGVT
jgi:DNA invertase Pin-like site-specific DNA recombinase